MDTTDTKKAVSNRNQNNWGGGGESFGKYGKSSIAFSEILTFVEKHHNLLKHFHEGHVVIAVFLKGKRFFMKFVIKGVDKGKLQLL